MTAFLEDKIIKQEQLGGSEGMNSKAGRIVALLCMAALPVIGLPMMNMIRS